VSSFGKDLSTRVNGAPDRDRRHGYLLHHGSYYPQLTGSAGDLSLKMFLTLAAGVALCVAYGFLKSDVVIIIVNSVNLALLMTMLCFKLRETVRRGEMSVRGGGLWNPEGHKLLVLGRKGNAVFDSAADVQTIVTRRTRRNRPA
jgi:hypothetical protein